MRFFRALAVTLALTGVAAGCAPNTQNTQASIAEEQRASRQLVADLRAKDKLITDRGLNTYVNGVVNRIAGQRPPGSVPLQAYIVKDASINAFTTGGGYLFVNAGLLAAMENEAQWATVAAHEVAHIDRGHISAGKANRQAVGVLGAIVGIGAAAAGVSGGLTNLAIGLGQNAAVSSFSRSQETDADTTGFKYASAAGYNMVEGAKSFEVLARVYGSQGGLAAAFFSSHPQSPERQAQLTSLAQQSGATRGRIGKQSHDNATKKIRREVLEFLEAEGRNREAAQIRKNLRG
ncbi:MAG: M48 family metalloprotease [Pseudomonadota bacterium]